MEARGVNRSEPNYMCKPLVTKAYIQEEESNEFINKMFGGSISHFFTTFVQGKQLSEEKVESLKKIIDDME